MQLREYIFRKNQKFGDFADLLEISRTYFSLIVNGKRRMHPELALRIEDLTHGLVTRDEALFPEKYPDWRI